MSENKGKNEKHKEKLPLRRQLQNHASLLRVIIKACPSRLVYEVLIGGIGAFAEFLSYSLLLRYALNGISEGKSFGYIVGMIAAFFGANALVGAVSQWYNSFRAPILEENATKYVQKILFDKARSVDLSCYENTEFYDKYVKAMNEGANRVDEFIVTVGWTVYIIVTLVSNAALAFTIDPVLALFALIPFATSFIKLRTDKLEYDKSMLEAEQGRRRRYVRRIFYLNEFAKEVRLTHVDRPMMNYYDRSSETVLAGIKKYGIRLWMLSYLRDIAQNVFSYLGAIVYCVVRTSAGFMPYGDAVVAINTVSNVSGMLASAVGSFTDFRKIALYTDNLRKFLDYTPAIREDENGLEPRGGEIVFDHVSFTYEGCEGEALTDVSLRIGKGERVALVGHNGAGKSTLIKLLLRLYEPTSGHIYLDGRDISEYKLSAYRAGFGTVFQDVRQFSLSVAENVLGRRPRTDEDRETVIAALKKSGSYDRVMKMKNGIDTVLTREFDDEGEVLSGGEAQKLAIARVFTRDNFCIILDEPTSALDPLAEAEMYSRMRETAGGERSLLFISHRLSSAVDADRIYLIDGGRIAESGSHAELIEKGGAYASMFARQAENYRTSGDKRKEAANNE